MTEKQYQMRNTNLADEMGRIYYNIQRNDGVNICQVYGKNNAKSLIDELNELNDEIEFLKFALDSNRELTMEVEQEQCRLYKKLEKENKELKHHIKKLEKEVHFEHMRAMFSTVKSFKGDVSKRYYYSEETDTLYDTANNYGQYDKILDKKEIAMLLNEYETLLDNGD